MIDTHTHLYDEKFNDDRPLLIQKAIDSGVQKMFMPNCDRSTIEGMLAVEAAFPKHCFAMMGLHPCSVGESVGDELAAVAHWLGQRKFCAVGEIGLDYYWDKTFVAQQKMAFRQQIEWALQYNLPIIIHTRDAMNDTIELVQEYVPRGIRGVFHCFSGSYESAQRIIKMGFYLGIGGVLTYKNAGLQEVVQRIDMQHLVLETDAPYLTPVPHRGQRNESSYIHHVATKLSELKGISVQEVEAITDANAEVLYGGWIG